MKCHVRPFRSKRADSRTGLSLVVVMIAISMSLVLTYAALSSQARGVQVRQNVNRKALARQVAESAAAIALNAMQSPTWSGVSTPMSGTLSRDAQGTTSYSVSFLTIDGQTSPTAYPAGQGQTTLPGSGAFFDANSPGLSANSAEQAVAATHQALQLLIRSTGQWQSATDPLDVVTETIEVGVELQPRVPGRPILAPDIPEATDVLPSNAAYDTIQGYALFASANGKSSLTLEPGHRIDGPTWLNDGITLFGGPRWNGTTRGEFLHSTGALYSVTNNGTTKLLHPHPFGGPVTMLANFSASEVADLSKLNVPRVSAASSLATPSINFANWRTYQLYQGGFSYSAEVLTSGMLYGVVLRPSPRNPLGVFYYEGNLTIGNNVVIQGTLVCSGRLTFTGQNVQIGSLNWRDARGGALVASGELFPRPPAIVAGSMQVNSSTRAAIDGAVLLTGALTGADGSFDFVPGNELNLSGSQATSAPIRQPYSLVQLPASTNLSSVTGDGGYAIWLADGDSGNWFPIIDVDATNRQLTVLGEANRPKPTSFRIRRQRIRCFDVRGPVMTSRATLSVSGSWRLSSSLWNNQYSLWELENEIRTRNGVSPVPFVSWVANPANYVDWGSPWESVGLPLEPVVHIRPQMGVKFRDSLPLFRSYVAPANLITAKHDPSGYRWRVLFWRDLP